MNIFCCAEQNLRVNYLLGCMKSSQLWTASSDREPFGMRCPISQLFSVNYQPTTCQTLTIKMSATEISPSQKGAMKSAE